MTRVITDNATRSKLGGLTEHIMLCDELGSELGHFLPADMYHDFLDGVINSLFTEDELRRAQKETTGRPLMEIWNSLGRA